MKVEIEKEWEPEVLALFESLGVDTSDAGAVSKAVTVAVFVLDEVVTQNAKRGMFVCDDCLDKMKN